MIIICEMLPAIVPTILVSHVVLTDILEIENDLMIRDCRRLRVLYSLSLLSYNKLSILGSEVSNK
jgi:hypothetical protein